MPRACIAALILLALASCQKILEPRRVEPAVAPGGGEVSFEFAGQNDAAMILPVTINGQEGFDFILDTGATLTCVSRDVAKRLKLPENRRIRGIGATLGGSGEFGLVEIDSLSIGETKLSGLAACTVDLSPMEKIGIEIDGLLGLNALKPFRVTIDFERRTVRLEDPA